MMPVDEARAWRVRQLGAPHEALRLEPSAARPPGPGEVRVEVEAIGLNYPDLLLCAGLYQEHPELPFTPCYEAVGVVAAVGDGVDLGVGDRVLAIPDLPEGALQTSLTVPVRDVYRVPASMPREAAASLYVAYQTAYVALHERANLRAGETLVVTGAAGGVGSAAVQLGKAAGATVIAIVTGAAKARACRKWGADHVIDLADAPEVAKTIRALSGGRGADVIIDVVGGDLFDQLRKAVAFGSRVLVIGFTAGRIGDVPANHVLLRNYAVLGLYLNSYRYFAPEMLARVHDELIELWERGSIAPVVHETVVFDEAPAALSLLAGRAVIGRVVVTVDH